MTPRPGYTWYPFNWCGEVIIVHNDRNTGTRWVTVPCCSRKRFETVREAKVVAFAALLKFANWTLHTEPWPWEVQHAKDMAFAEQLKGHSWKLDTQPAPSTISIRTPPVFFDTTPQ